MYDCKTSPLRFCLAVTKVEGVQVPGDMDAAIRKIAETMPCQFSSTEQDLTRGKRSEIDYFNGLIRAARRGAGDCDADEPGVVGVGEVGREERGLLSANSRKTY